MNPLDAGKKWLPGGRTEEACAITQPHLNRNRRIKPTMLGGVASGRRETDLDSEEDGHDDTDIS